MAWRTAGRRLPVLRGLLGFAEGSANPAGMKATAEWFPARERGLAGGVYNIGASVGSMLAPPLVVWAILTYNWQMAFVITGEPGPGLGGPVALAVPVAREASSALRQERAHIAAGQEAHLRGDGRRPSIAHIARQRNFWGIALPRFLADPTWGTLTFWVPLYLTTVRHFDLKQIALFAWMPFLAADLGCLFGGALVIALQKRGVSLINARRWAFTLGACLMMGMGFVGVVESPYAAIALLSLGGFAHQTLSVTVITMSSDLFKRTRSPRWLAWPARLATPGCSLLAAHRRPGRDGRLHAVFHRPGVLDLAGAALLWTLVRDPQASMPHDHHAIRFFAASTPTRRSCGSATTTTSRRRPSSGFPACRSITRAISSIGGC